MVSPLLLGLGILVMESQGHGGHMGCKYGDCVILQYSLPAHSVCSVVLGVQGW